MPLLQLRRTHFHDFMIDVHQRLRHLARTSDPLTHVADELAEEVRAVAALGRRRWGTVAA